jgi:hypothetical protein
MAVMSALLFLLGVVFVPSALASPANANLSWNPPVIFEGQTTTATYGVPVNTDCPSGDFFTGTLTVTEPFGTGTSSVTQDDIPCGTVDLSAVYPTGFTGTAGTQCPGGPYSTLWTGSTTAVVDGVHPTFSVKNTFELPICLKVPEFGGPAVLVAAVGLVAVAAMRRSRIPKF